MEIQILKKKERQNNPCRHPSIPTITTMNTYKALIFLHESNKIEWVEDANSLIDSYMAYKYLMKAKVLTEKVILETHRQLMRSQDIPLNLKWAYRKQKVWIGGREWLDYMLIPTAIEKWLEKMNWKEEDWQALHVEYEKIHPFIDWNGRTGRMFMNWHRLKRLELWQLVIFNREKSLYYQWFSPSL